jgi:hypothetical protein
MRGLALAPHLIVAGLAWLYVLFLTAWSLLESTRPSEGLVLWPIVLLGALLFIGIPTLFYTWVLIRWWRTGRWWAIAIADALVAAIAAWNLVGSLKPGEQGNAAIFGLIAFSAVLGIVLVIRTRRSPDRDVGSLTGNHAS